MSTSFWLGSLWKSSTDPSDERDVDEADAIGESSGELASELVAVDGIESMVILRLRAASCGRAVVLIWGRNADSKIGVLAQLLSEVLDKPKNSGEVKEESSMSGNTVN